MDISIHALLAESDHAPSHSLYQHNISIHALLAESDLWVLRKVPLLSIFLSTLSLRRATWQRGSRVTYVEISIHALLAESDRPKRPKHQTQTHFYPRSPCGERLSALHNILKLFSISIHALLAESDSRPRRLKSRRCVFLSTLSLRRATVIC